MSSTSPCICGRMRGHVLSQGPFPPPPRLRLAGAPRVAGQFRRRRTRRVRQWSFLSLKRLIFAIFTCGPSASGWIEKWRIGNFPDLL
eukprot:6238081-Prymnesium_polylepis.1